MNNSNRVLLLKQFSKILRNRANNQKFPKLTNTLIAYYTRKELIEIIKKKHNNNIPKDYNLVEMENEELMNIIGDDIYFISYTTEEWSKNLLPKLDVTEKNNHNTKAKSNESTKVLK